MVLDRAEEIERTTEQGRTTGEERFTLDGGSDPPRRIAGGYALVPVWLIAAAWWLFRFAGRLDLADLRVFLGGIIEDMSRLKDKGRHGDQFPDHYKVADLVWRTGLALPTVERSLSRLAAVGLMTWSESGIAFADSPEDLNVDDLAGFRAMLAAFPAGGRLLPIPRRILRVLAKCRERTLIGTTLAHLLWGLYWKGREGTFETRGRVKTAWIADVFGLSRRGVELARRKLIEWEWLERLTSRDPIKRNGHGDLFEIDPDWNPRCRPGTAEAPTVAPPVRGESAPPPVESCGESAPLSSNKEPLSGGGRNQEPAVGPGPTGDCIQVSGGEETTLAAPTLGDVRREDLEDTGRLLGLYEQAVGRGLATDSEHDRLRFVAAAEHALNEGDDPCALFAANVRHRRLSFLASGDEDAANERLKRHDHGFDPARRSGDRRPCDLAGAVAGLDRSGGGGMSPGRVELGADAQALASILPAFAKVIGDRPNAAFGHMSRTCGWTRERYDRAVAELESARERRQLLNVATLAESLR